MTTIQLWLKHRPLARVIAREYFVPGNDAEDTEQEALIALWEAARTFDDGKGSFPNWARFVIRRRLVECLRVETTNKARVLNQSLRTTVCEGEHEEIVTTLPHLHQVSDRCETHDEVRRLLAGICSLNDWEQRCVLGIASGLSYDEIGGGRKRVDNTLSRSRKKLRAVMM